MSRFVTPRPKKLTTKMATAGAEPNVDKGISPYLERVAKYVPSEIIAAFITVNAIPFDDLPDGYTTWIQLGIFILFLILTPLYFKLLADPGDPLGTQQLMSMIAFIIWAYAIGGDGGVFGKTGFDIYYKSLATLFLVLFSVISSFVVPKEK